MSRDRAAPGFGRLAALLAAGAVALVGCNPVAVFEGDWRFDRDPYRATTVQDATLKPGGETFSWTVDVRTEIVVEHEPR